MGRLRLYSRGTGNCQYDSERGTDTDEQSDVVADAGGDGLLFYYVPGEAVWCHVEASRKAPEQFIARYEGFDSDDPITEFLETTRHELSAIEWPISSRTGTKHDAFLNLPPDPPADAPGAIEDVVGFYPELREVGAIELGAPSYEAAMSLVALARERIGEETSVLVSTDGDVAALEADVVVDYRPDLTEIEPVGNTAEELVSLKLDDHVRAAESTAGALATVLEAGAGAGDPTRRLVDAFDDRAFADAGMEIRPRNELERRRSATLSRWFKAAFVVTLLLSLGAVAWLHAPTVGEAIVRPIALPIPAWSVTDPIAVARTPSGVPLAVGLLVIAVSVAVVDRLIGSEPSASSAVGSAAEPTEQPDVDAGRSFDRSAFDAERDELQELLLTLRDRTLIRSGSDHRDVVHDILSTEFPVEVSAEGRSASVLRRSKAIGAIGGAVVALGIGVGLWLFVDVIVAYWISAVTVVWYAAMVLAVGTAVTAIGLRVWRCRRVLVGAASAGVRYPIVRIAALRRRGTADAPPSSGPLGSAPRGGVVSKTGILLVGLFVLFVLIVVAFLAI